MHQRSRRSWVLMLERSCRYGFNEHHLQVIPCHVIVVKLIRFSLATFWVQAVTAPSNFPIIHWLKITLQPTSIVHFLAAKLNLLNSQTPVSPLRAHSGGTLLEPSIIGLLQETNCFNAAAFETPHISAPSNQHGVRRKNRLM